MPVRALLWAGAFAFAFATTAHAAMTISNAKTKNVSCTGDVCTPTGGNANLNVGELQTMLASSDATVKSNAAAPDIGILDPLTWASSHRLTLDAYLSIHVRAPVAAEGTSGLTLTTNDGGRGGELVFGDGGYVNFWDLNSNLRVNGQSYVLVGDIHTLASDIAVDPAGYFALAKTYDASLDGTYSTAPIPTKFKGTLEGLGNTISNLTIVASGNPQTDLALFAWSSGSLRDLNLTNASVSDTGTGYVGILVGTNLGRIERVNAGGNVSGNQTYMLGGLVGGNGSVGEKSGGAIFHATSSVTVGGTAAFGGGIIGYNSGTIRWSQASGAVQALYSAGGLAGNAAGGTISQSFASGPVSADTKEGAAGGLVGSMQPLLSGATTTLEQCYATGKVSASIDGGLVGAAAEGGTISQCYAAGRVADRKSSGGFIGNIDNRFPPPDFTAAYWNKTTTRQDHGTGSGDFDGLTGLTGAQLKSALPAGFDKKIWGQDPDINHGWPYLLANPPQ